MRYLRVVFAPGVVPGKWFSRFDERTDGWQAAGAQSDSPLTHVLSRAADIGIVRFPGESWDGGVGTGELAGVPDIGEREMTVHDLHRVRLYAETPGIAVPKDHTLEALADQEPATAADLDGETVLYRGVSPSRVRENLEVVAANVGCVIAPRPLLRSVNRRGVVHRNFSGAPTTGIGLVWRRDRDDEVVQQFVGVCRGRRATSSR
ncbi:LysR substrate-binding domain-containing protein [uncultured Corynebacterium sp.]|uniref:LysR substrate-binding domain-containing protein n=1 Tax=uncultured Corynebacterium sp. TaxID=159447 RepID=UPI0025FE5C80|nr:LysR substrate-binding domain-containing protein [uncultured Corynebacterium sp.]